MTPLDEEVVKSVCESHGVGGDDIFLVQALMGRPPAQWPGCCGSGCVPCMDNITAAALELLKMQEEMDEKT